MVFIPKWCLRASLRKYDEHYVLRLFYSPHVYPDIFAVLLLYTVMLPAGIYTFML